MPIPLYLDAARMGLLTPSACVALQDFVRLAGETSCTLYFEHFWTVGTPSWDRAIRAKFQGLQLWQGIEELKAKLRHAAGVSAECPTFIAGRGSSLVKRAIRALCRASTRILITDLTWPAYARIIHHEAVRCGRQIARLPVRHSIHHQNATPDEILERFVRSYCRTGCDGAFVPEVSHDGIRLPIADLCCALREKSPDTKIVVDGAQAFAHVPIERSLPGSDCYLTGCHKWLGAHLPLGVAFCPRPESWALLRPSLDKADDPLFALCRRFETRTENRFGETVNLTPLIACRGALADLGMAECELVARLQNALRACARIDRTWRPLLPHKAFRSGILLLKSSRACPGAHELRSRFAAEGVMLSAYDGGLVRLSMPNRVMTNDELELLAKAFGHKRSAKSRQPAT